MQESQGVAPASGVIGQDHLGFLTIEASHGCIGCMRDPSSPVSLWPI